MSKLRGREAPAAMSLRHTETNLRHIEASLPDFHTLHEPPPYSTRDSTVVTVVRNLICIEAILLLLFTILDKIGLRRIYGD